ncbi:hypothetical protein A7P55_12230 [Acinetobacter sp. Ac_5812]|nr:hypothetical protein [Acinetobacter sp. Ac_5812]
MSNGDGLSSNQNLETANDRIAQLEEELADFKGTHIAFINDVPAMKSRILELQGDTYVGQSSELPDYSSMTSDQIRAVLDGKGIKWLARDSKDTLLSYLTKTKE